jgi:hypothetical protein
MDGQDCPMLAPVKTLEANDFSPVFMQLIARHLARL